MNQPELFDSSRTTVTLCPVCRAVREPGQERTPACRYDLDRDTARRPIGCLNAVRPEFEEVPY